MQVVSAEKVSKNYTLRQAAGRFGWIKKSGRIVRALQEVSFSIERGEAVSVLGPNGAGKTTLIKTLSGVLLPTAGTVRCLGMEPAKSRMAYTQRIGVLLGQKSGLIFDLPLLQSYEFLRAVYGLTTAEFRRQLDMLVELLELGDLLRVPVRKLSLGQRMRAELIAALLHSPELLFLDEPTIGLDLLVRDKIHGLLKRIRAERDLTIVLTTHNPRDVEEVTERAIMVDNGVIMYDGAVEGLRVLSDTRMITFRLLDPRLGDEIAGRFGADLTLQADGRQVAGKISMSRDRLNAVLAQLLEYGDELDGVAVDSPSLEEGIKQFYRQQGGGVTAQ